MHYTAQFFRDNMPEWKRRKDPPLSRVFYRKIAFHCAAFAANRGITANQVSYFSLYVGIVASLLFLFNKPLAIAGAILVNFWLVLDCTDGNLARSVKSQPFGEFADGISSYVLVGMICTTMGFYVYQNGGLLIPTGTPWIILAGAFASSSDTMMRLIYQKYKRTEQEMAEQGKITVEHDDRVDHSKVNSLRVRLESDFGFGGYLPLLVLIGVVFNALDLVVLYCLVYYGGSCLISSAATIRKAQRAERLQEEKESA